MNLFKKELKNNFKGFVIFTGILLVMILLVTAIYPSIMKDSSAIEQMMSSLPDSILKIFNMDVISITKVLGWYATEGYIFVGLLGGCYAASLGATILSKEQNDKTSEFLLSRPITRTKVVTMKILVAFIYITMLHIAITIATLICFSIIDTIDYTKWALLMVGPYMLCLVLASITMFISCFMRKTSKISQLAIGITIGTYIIHVISGMSEKLEFLKYISPYEYANSSMIMANAHIPFGYILTMLIMMILMITLTYVKYNKKDFS